MWTLFMTILLKGCIGYGKAAAAQSEIRFLDRLERNLYWLQVEQGDAHDIARCQR
jgi:hypothetical protein